MLLKKKRKQNSKQTKNPLNGGYFYWYSQLTLAIARLDWAGLGVRRLEWSLWGGSGLV